MKDAKNMVLKVVGIMAAVMVCMAAYYGISMFQLQNDIHILDQQGFVIAIACACSAMACRRKKQQKAEV